jgi:hypothetical protein
MTQNADSGRVIEIVIISGVEGPSVYLDNHRIAGNKPWGGGDVLYEWKADLADILAALRLPVVEQHRQPAVTPNASSGTP